MSAQSISPAFTSFQNIDGQPLENGYIYIGTAGLAAITNQITVYWDAALTVPATQPIRTTGGFPMNSSSPGRIFVGVGDYSVSLNDKNNSPVYSNLNAGKNGTEAFTSVLTGATTRTITDKLSDTVSVKDFGAVGDGVTDDLAAINAAIDTGYRVFFPQGTYLVSATITLNDNEHLLLDAEATIQSAATPVIHFHGESSSVIGAGKSSFIYCTGASTSGVVFFGHSSTSDAENIFYNELSGLSIRGNDSFGAVEAYETSYTQAVMFFSAETWGSGSAVYYNKCSDLFIQDTKEGILLAGIINANFFDSILFWRIGQTAFHLFAPQAADTEGDRYGYDWDTQTLAKTSAENLISNVFVDTAFLAYGNTPGYAARTFSDGQTYPADGTMLRITGHNVYHQFLNFSGEPTDGTAFEIAADTTRVFIQGAFNADSGTNNALTTTSGTSIMESGSPAYTQISAQNALLYSTSIHATGSEAAPAIFDRFQTGTGIYFPAAGTMAFTSTGSEKMRVNATGVAIGTKTPTGTYPFEVVGNSYHNGDIRLKSTYPILDNTYSLGTGSFRWTVVYATTGTINTSDERQKTEIGSINDAILRAWGKVEFYKFKMIDSVTKKGNGARWHFGVIAQRVKEAFESEGLDPFDYGILCYDEFEALEDTLDADGNVILEGHPEGSIYGIRYEEALVLECAYLRSKLG
jgi:hypothetical protein